MSDSPKPAPATPLNPRRRGIIIGASGGIGAALSRKLAREGFTLALIDRNKTPLQILCDEINQAGREGGQCGIHPAAARVRTTNRRGVRQEMVTNADAVERRVEAYRPGELCRRTGTPLSPAR